jgi:hypothetical protein
VRRHVWRGRRRHAGVHAAARGVVSVLARSGPLESAVGKRRGPWSLRGSFTKSRRCPAKKRPDVTAFELLLWALNGLWSASISRQTSSAHRKPTIPAQRSSWASVAIALRGCWRGSRSAGKNPTRLGTSLRRRRCRRWRTSRTCWARPGSPAAERLRGSATLWPPSRSSPSAGRPGLRRRRPNPSLGSPARR